MESDSVLIIVIFLCVLFFGGDPDLSDKIGDYLFVNSCESLPMEDK